MRAHMHMQAITVHSTAEGVGVLVVRVVVSCEVCGTHDFAIAGHHVKPLLAMLQGVVDEVDPALVDAGGDWASTVQRSSQSIPDPRNN